MSVPTNISYIINTNAKFKSLSLSQYLLRSDKPLISGDIPLSASRIRMGSPLSLALSIFTSAEEAVKWDRFLFVNGRARFGGERADEVTSNGEGSAN